LGRRAFQVQVSNLWSKPIKKEPIVPLVSLMLTAGTWAFPASKLSFTSVSLDQGKGSRGYLYFRYFPEDW